MANIEKRRFYISTGLYSQRAFDVLNCICESFDLVFLTTRTNFFEKNFLNTDTITFMKFGDIKRKLHEIITRVDVAIDYSTHEVIFVPCSLGSANEIECDLRLSKNDIHKAFAEVIEFFAENMKSDVVKFSDFKSPNTKFHRFVVHDAKIVADVMLGRNVKEKYDKKDIDDVVGLENDAVKQEMIEVLEEEIASLHSKLLQKLDVIYAEANKKIVKINQETNAKIDMVYAKMNRKAEHIRKETENHIADCKSKVSKLAGMNSENKKKFFDIKSFEWVDFKHDMIETQHTKVE